MQHQQGDGMTRTATFKPCVEVFIQLHCDSAEGAHWMGTALDQLTLRVHVSFTPSGLKYEEYPIVHCNPVQLHGH